MTRTKEMKKIFDSSADPYIEQKHVIMCRSGIQMYHKSELQSFMKDNPPPVDKEWYREYRPANVVVKAKELFKSLPCTKEHPSDWVTPDNWKELAGGTTGENVDVVALDGEADGEIGIESSITFYDRDLYEYYQDNKEVSVGYNCKKHWVDNPDEVGYDIVLDEITDVNHLAITRAGRGGSSVAVIDSLIGGMKPMRTGFLSFLTRHKQTDCAETFGAKVVNALKNSKGETEEELAKDMQSVMDSIAICKDSEQKTLLVDSVKDCFDNKDKALANEEELVKTLDSMYVSVSGDSLEEIAKAFSAVTGNAEKKVLDSETSNEDSSEESEEKPDEKEGKDEDSEAESDEDSCSKDEKEKEEANKDSSPFCTKEEVQSIVESAVKEAVASALGVTTNKDSMPNGIELENETKTEVVGRDYSSFLDK